MPPQLENQFLKLQSCFKPINAREAGLARGFVCLQIYRSGSVITAVMPPSLMKWTIANCDILDRPADVLVLSGNPQLNLSGGAGAAFRMRYGDEMQEQMHQFLESSGKQFVEHGSVVQMPPCGSPYLAVLHAVGIDVFYDSNIDVITKTISRSLVIASELSAKTVALTAIATGYGKMSMADFAAGVQPVTTMEFKPIENVDICLMKSHAVTELASLIPGALVA